MIPVELGATFARRYRVEREIGRGGMATVYLAHDAQLNRAVALKLLSPDVGAALGNERFHREIQLSAQLRHPHIVPVLDGGVAEGLCWYAMPFVEGESLRDRLLRETHLPIDEAVHIAREVADALGYAHSLGIIHRDVKPENILLSEGHALLADFGIAKVVHDEDAQSLTATGLSIGTPAYMSPEQASGVARLDARSDVYSLACVVYEMLAGQPPFTAPTPQSLLARHVIDPVPPLRTLRASVSAGLEATVLKGLAKVPADRFSTTAAFVEALTRPAEPVTVPARRRRAAAGTIAALGLVMVTALAVRASRGRSAEPPVGSMHSLAVLPVENLTGDTAQLYLADAMMDQLITDLAQVGALRVVARTSVLSLGDREASPTQIGRRLRVDGLLSGSVQRAGDSLRVSVQLSSATTGETLWARRFDGPVEGILRLQSLVANAVVEEMQVRVTRAEHSRLSAQRASVDPRAYQAYVKGRYWWNRRGESNLHRALAYFDQALEVDPTYGAAYSGMADAYLQLGYASLLAPDEAFPKVRRAAQRAIELDSTLAEPHAALGFYNLYYEWDWAAAEREFETALALNPNYATAHEWYSLFLTAMGRFDEAEAHVARAMDLDPLSVPVAGTAGWVAHYSGRSALAERRLRAAIAADSLNPLIHLYLGRVLEAAGNRAEAMSEYARTGSLRDWVPTIAAMGVVEAEDGQRQHAIQTLARLDTLGRTRYVTAYAIALVHSALGNRDSAFTYLERAVRERTHWLVWLRRDTRWTLLRGDPRFDELIHRIGLP